MRVNGSAKLVCKTRIKEVAPIGEVISIEPMGNMPVIKDLVSDMDAFWSKVRSVDPYVKTDFKPEAEHIASNDSMTHLLGVMNCIMCGACVSDCTVLEVDNNFIGPAALAKAYRFVKDPRDGRTDSRLEFLNEPGGVWDCTRCMQCVEVCPKDVDPMHRIMALRGRAIDAGYDNTVGARHTKVFEESLSHSRRIKELIMKIKTF